jgi:hypothetical protein
MRKRRAKHRRPPPTRRRAAGLLILTLAVVVVTAARLASFGAGALPVKIAAASTPGTRAHGRPSPPPSPVRTPPVRRPTARRPAAAPARQVSGRSVTAIGDSVMVASTPALEQDLPGIYVNAVVGRQFATGLQVLASLRQSGQLRQVVVFGLGTNGTVTAGQIGQLFATIEHRTYLLWPDGIHPQPAGGVLYARVVKAAVQRVANSPS